MSLKSVLLGILLTLLASFGSALGDELEERQKVAHELVTILKDGGVYDRLMQRTVERSPAEIRDKVRGLIDKHLDPELVLKEWENIAVDIFTLEEMKALAVFYKTDVGRSILLKRVDLGLRMSDAITRSLEESMKKAK